jgi:hypothetical protein
MNYRILKVTCWWTSFKSNHCGKGAYVRRFSRGATMSDAGKIEQMARQLCRASGNDPDKTVRFGTPLTLNVDGCQIIRVLMLPAWREHMREARRMVGEVM